MKKLIENFPNQLREALDIANRAKLSPKHNIQNIVVTGLGGSGIGGTIISELVSDSCPIPILINKDYSLPGFVNHNSLVIISSYSGNTEETVSGLNQALEKGAKIVCISSGGKILEIAKEKKLYKKEFQTTKYIIEYYEALFPWLREYVGFNSDELIKSIYLESNSEEEDPVSFYITKSEFENLSVTERNQRALDRYWNRSKDPWQIGRDYERYIGYLYEIKGFKVQYHGIEKLKNDLGRDLICTKGNHIEVIQCKYWSNQKGIPVLKNFQKCA